MNRAVADIARKGTSCLAEKLLNLSSTIHRSHGSTACGSARLAFNCNSGPTAAWLRHHPSEQLADPVRRYHGLSPGHLLHFNSAIKQPNSQSCNLGQLRCFQTSSTPLARDYYETLGVSRSASDNDIKKSYYRLAKKYHPDANPGDNDAVRQFQEVQEAYDILRDPQKRAMYDQVGHQGFQDGGGAQGGGGFPGGFPFGGGGFQGGFAGQDMDEVLQNMAKEFFGRQGGMGGMGGMFSSYQATTSVSIGFMESLKGTHKTLSMDLGDGSGTRNVNVDVPAGVEHGQQLLIQDVIRTSTTRVNLVVQVQVKPHKSFTRKGVDIWSQLHLKLSQAILGCTATVETAWGSEEVRIPRGTQPGAKIVIPGKGAPRLQGSGRGKHVLEVNLAFPSALSQDQLRAIEQLQRLGL